MAALRSDEDLDTFLDTLAAESGTTRAELLRQVREAAKRRLAEDRDALPPDEARPADL